MWGLTFGGREELQLRKHFLPWYLTEPWGYVLFFIDLCSFPFFFFFGGGRILNSPQILPLSAKWTK